MSSAGRRFRSIAAWPALSSSGAAGECGQCHVVSVRRKVNLFFSSSVKTVPLDTFHWQDYPRRKLTVVYGTPETVGFVANFRNCVCYRIMINP